MTAAIDFTLARDLGEGPETRFEHARRAARSTEVRVARGAYARSREWAEASADARYLAVIGAIAATRTRSIVLSHWSAAAVHQLPMVGHWPTEVHVTQPPESTSRSRNLVVRHTTALAPEDVVCVSGLLVTSLARTLVDICATRQSVRALVMTDAAIRLDRKTSSARITKSALLEAIASRQPFARHARARNTIEFAESGAESPLESISRLTMRGIACPAPVLQLGHYDDDGLIGYADFAWPDYGVVAEADGRNKYLDESLRSGRSVEQVIVDEKLREDRIRSLPRKFTRWGWDVGNSPVALAAKLRPLGLPVRVRPR